MKHSPVGSGSICGILTMADCFDLMGQFLEYNLARPYKTVITDWIHLAEIEDFCHCRCKCLAHAILEVDEYQYPSYIVGITRRMQHTGRE
jgi:hypothetical protein